MLWKWMALLSLVAAAPAAAQTVKGPDNRSIEQAILLANSKAWDQALPLLDQYMTAFDRILVGHKGVPFCAKDDVELRRIIAFVHADTSNGVILSGREPCMALYLKATALMNMGRFRDAIPVLERAVAMAPMDSVTIDALGYAYLDSHEWQLSYEVQAKALIVAQAQTDPETRQVTQCMAWRGMAKALVAQRRLNEATQMLNKCLAIQPSDEEATKILEMIVSRRP
jgi:tetratricopeptide (TPR) repeat protein